MKEFMLNITKYSKEHIMSIVCIVKNKNNGWNKSIEDLTIDVDENYNIFVKGITTKKIWNEFETKVIKDTKLDYLFETTNINDFEEQLMMF